MARLSASSTGTARVAVLGSTTNDGVRLRQALAESGLPGARVDLYGATESEEPILSEYDGEARLIQTPNVEELLDHDVVFLCEPGEIVERLLDRAGRETAIIDVART